MPFSGPIASTAFFLALCAVAAKGEVHTPLDVAVGEFGEPKIIDILIDKYIVDGKPYKTAEEGDPAFFRDVIDASMFQNLGMAKTELGVGNMVNRRLQSARCFRLNDGSVACVIEGFPSDEFLIMFFDCTEGATVQECGSCTIVFEDDFDDLGNNDPRCRSCRICSNEIAIDCTNVADGDCASTNCRGECTNGSSPNEPEPVPSAPPRPRPTPLPTNRPTTQPTLQPTPLPKTPAPSPRPTPRPTSRPTIPPTPLPKTPAPSPRPTSRPTSRPTIPPTPLPKTPAPSPRPTPRPTGRPTIPPTPLPKTPAPSPRPTPRLTSRPTIPPTPLPKTPAPNPLPTPRPTPQPTLHPTPIPTRSPTQPTLPNALPTVQPTPRPTLLPTSSPTSPRTTVEPINPSPVPTSPPTFSPVQNPTVRPTFSGSTPDSQGAQCFQQRSDDSISCVLGNYPSNDFLTIFFNCSSLESVNVVEDCQSCTVVMENSLEDLEQSDPTCTACTICNGTVAFDCSNLATTGDCTSRNCAGECRTPIPVWTETTLPTSTPFPTGVPSTAPKADTSPAPFVRFDDPTESSRATTRNIIFAHVVGFVCCLVWIIQ